jgi:hypothetical protein
VPATGAPAAAAGGFGQIDPSLVPYILMLAQRPDALLVLNQWAAQGIVSPQVAVAMANALIQLSAQGARGSSPGVHALSFTPAMSMGGMSISPTMPGIEQFPGTDWSLAGGFSRVR